MSVKAVLWKEWGLWREGFKEKVSSPIQEWIHVDGDKGYKWIQLVSGLHVSGVNAA